MKSATIRDAGHDALLQPKGSLDASEVREARTAFPQRPPGLLFAGKAALIIGSGHGLGTVIARHLARLGAAVAVNSFPSSEAGEQLAAALSAEGHSAMHAWGSIAEPDHLDEMVAGIESRFGRLDFLVSAASNMPLGPLAAFAPDDWERAFTTEVVGLHQAAFRCAPLMLRGGGGKIVTLTHPAAQRCFEGFALAGSVKAAVELLTRYLAIELGPKRIQVNAVSAGPLAEEVAHYSEYARLVPAWERRTPRHQLAGCDDVANAVAFLLADDTRMVNGSTLLVDGGLSLAL